ncbi:phage tail tube protein [Oceanirhabdus sp. W0125-5]|uniref:phage tail tube protein n=1 Tax=Oceanirhabdus sp. W0125-5 TaxID=2999116 RepID=UPI0022F3015D|nr:phage tail tube protein [Oceanirhabdus sp. W0125-5]WBW96050.1 phage tail tube protein [Oceanirhabdus sp. W0125-5]
MESKRIINGTWGECWLDSDKVAECFGLKAKVEFKKEEIKICGSFATETKTVGYKCKGSMKLHKVNSRIAKKLGDEAKKGKDLRFTIISKLEDPDSYGAERVVLKSVNFDDLTLLDWEAGKPGTVEVPFTFTDYEYLDTI